MFKAFEVYLTKHNTRSLKASKIVGEHTSLYMSNAVKSPPRTGFYNL